MTNVAFPAKGKMGDSGVHHHFTALPHLQSHKSTKGKKSKHHQATGCTWPREGWLVGSRKWREERKQRFWITAAFWLKNACFEAQGDILLFFSSDHNEAEGHNMPQCLLWRQLLAFQIITSPCFRYVQNSSAGDTALYCLNDFLMVISLNITN